MEQGPEHKSLSDSQLKPGLEEMLGFLMSRTSYLLRKHVVSELNQESPDQISAGEELALLARVLERPGLSQAQLTDLTFKNKSTVSRLLKSLHKKKFVERAPDQHDKRAFRIFLTPEGEARIRRFLELISARSQEMSEGVSESDLEVTRQVLKTMYFNVLKLHQDNK